MPSQVAVRNTFIHFHADEDSSGDERLAPARRGGKRSLTDVGPLADRRLAEVCGQLSRITTASTEGDGEVAGCPPAADSESEPEGEGVRGPRRLPSASADGGLLSDCDGEADGSAPAVPHPTPEAAVLSEVHCTDAAVAAPSQLKQAPGRWPSAVKQQEGVRLGAVPSGPRRLRVLRNLPLAARPLQPPLQSVADAEEARREEEQAEREHQEQERQRKLRQLLELQELQRLERQRQLEQLQRQPPVPPPRQQTLLLADAVPSAGVAAGGRLRGPTAAASRGTAALAPPPGVLTAPQGRALAAGSWSLPTSPLVPAGAPQPNFQQGPGSGSRAVTSVSLPGGISRVCWELDSRRLAGHDTTIVSPAFSVDLPGSGPRSFKLLLHSSRGGTGRGSTGFRAAKGRGRIELKCDMRIDSPRDDEPFSVVVDKPEGARLGMDMTTRHHRPWCVSRITGGLIARWNAEHPELAVAPGDRLIEVNGVREPPELVMEACQRSGVLRLIVERPGQARSVAVTFGLGRGDAAPEQHRGPVLHRFAEQSLCGLPRSEEEWDFLAAVDKSSKKVSIHVQLSGLDAAATRR